MPGRSPTITVRSQQCYGRVSDELNGLSGEVNSRTPIFFCCINCIKYVSDFTLPLPVALNDLC